MAAGDQSTEQNEVDFNSASLSGFSDLNSEEHGDVELQEIPVNVNQKKPRVTDAKTFL